MRHLSSFTKDLCGQIWNMLEYFGLPFIKRTLLQYKMLSVIQRRWLQIRRNVKRTYIKATQSSHLTCQNIFYVFLNDKLSPLNIMVISKHHSWCRQIHFSLLFFLREREPATFVNCAHSRLNELRHVWHYVSSSKDTEESESVNTFPIRVSCSLSANRIKGNKNKPFYKKEFYQY